MSTRSASTAERFVGRATELRQLEAACRAAAAGRGTLVVVSGPTGIGRTRFGDELARRAEALDLRVVVGRCWPDGGAPALWPWQPIVAEMCGREAATALDSPPRDPTADGGDGADGADGGGRFRWLAEVAGDLAAACADRPTCVIVDDIHAADADALLLARLVGRSLAHVPLVLVLTRRTDVPEATEATAASGEAQRLIDDIAADALPVVLPPLGPDDARALLPVDDELAAVVWQLTGGRPRALHRVAALGPSAPDHGDDDDGAGAVPPGLRLAVDEAVGRLSATAQRVLRTSAVLGPAPLVAMAAEVAGRSPVEVLDAVAEAREVGLAGAEGPDRFAFAHPLVQAALADGLAGAERLDAHARAARVTAGAGPGAGGGADADPAAGARHALAAAPRSPDDARHAVAACVAAATALAGRGQPVPADELLTAAVELHDGSPLGPPGADLLVAWAQSGLARGRIGEARSRFERAARAADDAGDPVLAAEAALGLGGHGVGEQRTLVERTAVLERQRRALDGLPDGHPLRGRLAARLAAEAVVDGGPVEPLRRALDAARSGGDPRVLGEVLVLCHHVSLTPVHDRERLGWADEIIRVATVSGDDVLGLTGLWFRTIDLLHLGDSAALPALAELRQRAVARGAEHVLTGLALADVLLEVRAGRLDTAEAAADRAYQRGRALGDVDAAGYRAAQRLGIAWLRGRDGDMVDHAETVAATPEVQYAGFAYRACAAAIAARGGRPARARALLDDLAPDGLAAVASSSTWLVGMLGVAELAVALHDPHLARTVYDLVGPYAGVPTLGGAAVLCLGSTEWTLGVAARTFGDHDRAIGHLERAIAENRRLPHRPMAAVAEAELATALVARDGRGDRDRAAELLAAAIAAGEDMALDRRVAAWRDDLASLSAPAASAAPASPAASAAPPAPGGGVRHGMIRQVDDRWVVALDGHRVRVGDLLGMRYLSELLTRPGQVIAAVTLASRGAVPRPTTRQEVLDDEARAAYAARAHELTAELAQAEDDNDIGRAERLRLEMDALVDELESATGLGGRSRTFGDPAERARTSVRKAIKRAIDVIDDANPAIAETLRATVTTGTSCTYTPDPRTPIIWSPTDPPTPTPAASPPPTTTSPAPAPTIPSHHPPAGSAAAPANPTGHQPTDAHRPTHRRAAPADTVGGQYPPADADRSADAPPAVDHSSAAAGPPPTDAHQPTDDPAPVGGAAAPADTVGGQYPPADADRSAEEGSAVDRRSAADEPPEASGHPPADQSLAAGTTAPVGPTGGHSPTDGRLPADAYPLGDGHPPVGGAAAPANTTADHHPPTGHQPTDANRPTGGTSTPADMISDQYLPAGADRSADERSAVDLGSAADEPPPADGHLAADDHRPVGGAAAPNTTTDHHLPGYDLPLAGGHLSGDDHRPTGSTAAPVDRSGGPYPPADTYRSADERPAVDRRSAADARLPTGSPPSGDQDPSSDDHPPTGNHSSRDDLGLAASRGAPGGRSGGQFQYPLADADRSADERPAVERRSAADEPPEASGHPSGDAHRPTGGKAAPREMSGGQYPPADTYRSTDEPLPASGRRTAGHGFAVPVGPSAGHASAVDGQLPGGDLLPGGDAAVGGRAGGVERRAGGGQGWRFVGRRGEIELLRGALGAVGEGAPSLSVVHVHGPGGVGKTALLGVFAAEAEAAGARSVRLDMRTTEPTPAAFLRRLGTGLGWVGADLTPDALAGAGRVVVLVDALERAAPLAGWLRDELIAHLPPNVLVVLAGRHPPDTPWPTDPRERVVALGNLSPDEVRHYLHLHDVPRPWHDRLVGLTHGHPLALALAVDVLRQRQEQHTPPGDPHLDDLDDASGPIALLLGRFVDEVDDPRRRAALAVWAHARFTTEDLLQAALGGDDAGWLLAWLRSRPFVEDGRFGVFPHDLAREVLDADLRWRDGVAYEDLHRRMRAHIAQRIRRTAGVQAGVQARHRAAADALYLHRHSPVMRPMYDWSELGATDVDRLSPAEHADVRAMAGRRLGPEEAALVDHWLEHQPAAFLAFRRGGRLVGFATLLRLDRVAPDAGAADPGTRAAWDFARRHDPPRPGEAVGVARFVVDAANPPHGPRRPSPAWEGFSIAHVLQTLETPDLAWDFMAAFADPADGPALDHVGYHRVPEADFVVDGDVRRVFAHDWRRPEWQAFLDAKDRMP